MSSSTSLTQSRSNLPSTDVSRINIVSAVAFLVPLLIGALTAIVLGWAPGRTARNAAGLGARLYTRVGAANMRPLDA